MEFTFSTRAGDCELSRNSIRRGQTIGFAKFYAKPADVRFDELKDFYRLK